MNRDYSIYVATVRETLVRVFGKTDEEAAALVARLEPMSDTGLNEHPYLAAYELAYGNVPLSIEQYRRDLPQALEIWEEMRKTL